MHSNQKGKQYVYILWALQNKVCTAFINYYSTCNLQAGSIAVKESWVEQIKKVLMTQFDVIKGQRKKDIPVKPIAGWVSVRISVVHCIKFPFAVH